jgi:ArsR family transcriptional regulator
MSLLTAVADPVRWRVLQRLAGVPACVCELQEQAPVAANPLSCHLRDPLRAALPGAELSEAR